MLKENEIHEMSIDLHCQYEVQDPVQNPHANLIEVNDVEERGNEFVGKLGNHQVDRVPMQASGPVLAPQLHKESCLPGRRSGSI